jgi:hypothetical protein
LLGDGAKLLGVGALETKSTSGEDGLYAVFETPQGCITLFPQLYHKLATYAVLRDRDPLLLASLRSRAGEWCRQLDVPVWASSVALAGTIAAAFAVTSSDEVARRFMGGGEYALLS